MRGAAGRLTTSTTCGEPARPPEASAAACRAIKTDIVKTDIVKTDYCPYWNIKFGEIRKMRPHLGAKSDK